MHTRRTILLSTLAGIVPSIAGATISVPVIERLTLTILADGSVSSFATPVDQPGLRILPPPRPTAHQQTLRAEFGYSVLADASLGDAPRRIIVDFGYTPETLTSNMAILGVDPATIDAMVLSHGHYDHFGGLPALSRRVRRGTPLYIGGEEAFCARVRGASPDDASFGELRRTDLTARGIDLQIGPTAQIVANAAFTTGRISLISPERPRVPTSMLPGRGCRRADLESDRRDMEVFPDDAVHELGTAFHIRGKGLVVIGSCSHRGIINTVIAAQAASGIDRVYAIVGGFHLVHPQTAEQAMQTLELMREMDPSYILPGHCTGEAFIAPAIALMPDRVFRTVVGSRIDLS